MRRSSGAKVAWATRTASFASRTSTSWLASALMSRTLPKGSAMVEAFSQSISTLLSRVASSSKSLSTARDSSCSLRTFLCSSSLVSTMSRRCESLSNSSTAIACATGAMTVTSFRRLSISRRAPTKMAVAAFTARSVSRMAPNWSSLSSTTMSICSGAAKIATFSASSSTKAVFSSRGDSIFSTRAESLSSSRPLLTAPGAGIFFGPS
mmetsp:Transcript_10151/g.22818  ORF Transcript_10151/g.22818 Transcript_10151/m.22818 type:complete len:208 (-) Transcript_10151:382-1005(-)